MLHRLEVLCVRRVYKTFEFCESGYVSYKRNAKVEILGITRPTPYTLYVNTVETYRDLITKLLLQLPEVFIKSRGGHGASYREMGTTSDGTVWTTCALDMDQLFMLGLATGMMGFVSERKSQYSWKENPHVIVNL